MATKNLIDGLNNFSTNLTSDITSSATTIALDSVASLPSTQGILVIDRVNSSGTATPSTREYIRYSSIAGSSVVLDSAVVGRGFGGSTAQAHSAGAVVEMVVTAEHHNLLIDAFEAEHSDAGRHTFTDKAPVMNVKMLAYLNAAQTNLTDGTWTLVNIDTEVYDIGSDFNTTSHLFTAPVTGYYLITGKVLYDNPVADKTYKCAIYVDGAAVQENWAHSARIDTVGVQTTAIYAVTAGQTIGLYARVDTGANTVDLSSSATGTNLAIHLLSQDS